MDLKEQLDKVYQIEGLLLLLSSSDCSRDKFSDVRTLAVKLCSELADNLDSLSYGCQRPCEEAGEYVDENIGNPGASLEIDRKESAQKAEEAEPMIVSEEGGRTTEPLSLLRHAFTINDSFRFTRELFGNSRAAFSSAVGELSAMRTINEIESYLYTTLGWNSENEIVKDFVNVIQRSVK